MNVIFTYYIRFLCLLLLHEIIKAFLFFLFLVCKKHLLPSLITLIPVTHMVEGED